MKTLFQVPFLAPVKAHSFLRDICVVLGASIIISLSAPLAVPLPGTPLLLCVQCHVILFLATLLGCRRASMAVLLFLLQGALGFPVFSGGAFGVAYLAGMKGGYYFGYVFAAFVTGWLMENSKRFTLSRAFFSMAVGNLMIYVFGTAWLSCFVGFHKSILLGIIPFLVGDFLKLVLCTKCLHKFHKIRI